MTIRYIATGRAAGRTHLLTRWLLGGHPIATWPTWSRLVVVADHRLAEWTVRNNPAVDEALRDLGCPGGLTKVVVPARDVHDPRSRGRLWREVEVALDDVDLYGLRDIGIPYEQIVLATVTGEAATMEDIIDELHEALTDGHRSGMPRSVADAVAPLRWRQVRPQV